MIRPATLPVLCACAVLALAGCSGHEDPAPQTPTSEAVASPATIAPVFEGSGDGEDPTGAPAPPVSGDEDRAIAACVASQAFTAYMRRDLSPAAWLAGLQPYLSPSALEDYRGTDPRNVAPTKVISGPAVVPTPQPELARIHIVADDGTWLITLARHSGTDWKVEVMTPPDRDDL